MPAQNFRAFALNRPIGSGVKRLARHCEHYFLPMASRCRQILPKLGHLHFSSKGSATGTGFKPTRHAPLARLSVFVYSNNWPRDLRFRAITVSSARSVKGIFFKLASFCFSETTLASRSNNLIRP